MVTAMNAPLTLKELGPRHRPMFFINIGVMASPMIEMLLFRQSPEREVITLYCTYHAAEFDQSIAAHPDHGHFERHARLVLGR
jgi:hypothetical protein